MSDKYVTVEDFENYKKHVETIMKPKKESSKETKEVKPRLPNAYALFLKDTLPKVRAENKELSKNDHFKKVAELWKEHKEHKDRDHKE
jgi:hypothetical protein